ncbi:MAG: DUF616 domain-containing protein [Patescibacteria group bacterium]|nr:DUF616 domain-containing protein [Patescibacteria group bacterium]
MNKTVIYTAIFGGKDNLTEPEFIPDNCDFICFTDSDFQSDIWEVRKVEQTFNDPVRNARMYKVLPHKFLPKYEYSVWVDGNMVVRGDVNQLIKKYLSKVNLTIFDHTQLTRRFFKLFWKKDKNQCYDCIYTEAEKLIQMNNEGNYKDDSNLIKNQIEKYRNEGYPEHNGLVSSMVILRRHNEKDIINTMNIWWNEIENNSRRDQLSFNYSAWRSKLDFVYMKGDSRRNKYFLHKQHKTRVNPK